MPNYVVVVDAKADTRLDDEQPLFGASAGLVPAGIPVITTHEHLAHPDAEVLKGATVINLSRDYAYLGKGYYTSLLAEARGSKVLPTVATIQDLSKKLIYQPALIELDQALQKALSRLVEPPAGEFDLHVFFGIADDDRFRDLARAVFDAFRCPLLRVEIAPPDASTPAWHVLAVRPVSIRRVKGPLAELFTQSLERYTKAPWRAPKARAFGRYDLAILWNPKEALPPSSPKTLQKMVRIGKGMGIDVELIEKKDLTRVAEFDALFIRETTALDHHTFRFAKKAESEGIPVLDDPGSILRCTNKVYLAEMLRLHRLPTPRTVILEKGEPLLAEQHLTYPMVLKVPDGSFSLGVYKAKNRAELMEISARLFAESEIIIAQEYMYTEFDWRVGVLNRKPIFVCQYMMSRKHWQIVRHSASGRPTWGDTRQFGVEDAPREVVDVAVKAASLIGDGLYGVDLKQNERGVHIIEINDNPNIDIGYEDKVLKDDLYKLLFDDFIRRIEAVQAPPAPKPRAKDAAKEKNGNGKHLPDQGALADVTPLPAVFQAPAPSMLDAYAQAAEPREDAA
ncbi:MAG: RimK family protein [Alphaproteobacteria bacterium]|nr:RimK family protein [Alphaproteobacteria bacterium]